MSNCTDVTTHGCVIGSGTSSLGFELGRAAEVLGSLAGALGGGAELLTVIGARGAASTLEVGGSDGGVWHAATKRAVTKSVLMDLSRSEPARTR